MPRRLFLAAVFLVSSTFVFLRCTVHKRVASYSNAQTLGAVSTGKSSVTALDANASVNQPTNGVSPHGSISATAFSGSVPKHPGAEYTRVIVVPRMKNEDISWMYEALPDLNVNIYIANDPMSPFHPPKNKGHEVMVYLTYIIDHYEQLPDVIIFMHSHRFTHHNNEILGYDATQMLRRLSSEYVIRQGYVNMRCNWSPGCPEWLNPYATREHMGKQEEAVLAESWHELFPHDPLPKTLAQACCAQFALSRKRILSSAKSRYVFYRDWIMRTPLSDYVSGRIWEYSWQFLFTGQSVYCPVEHICYCDGYGVCFGDQAGYNDFEKLRQAKQEYEEEFKDSKNHATTSGDIPRNTINSTTQKTLEVERLSRLSDYIEALDKELKARIEGAIEHGNDPRNRAEECGRSWKEGDGF